MEGFEVVKEKTLAIGKSFLIETPRFSFSDFFGVWTLAFVIYARL